MTLSLAFLTAMPFKRPTFCRSACTASCTRQQLRPLPLETNQKRRPPTEAALQASVLSAVSHGA